MLWDGIVREIRLACRSISRSKGLVLITVLTLSLGIGSLVWSFSLAEALFLRPLGVSRPFELVRVAGISASGHETMLPSTMLMRLRNSGIFSGVCGFVTQELTIDVSGTLQAVPTQAFSGDCFRVFGVEPELGRLITSGDDFEGAPRVAVLTFATWKKDFNGDRQAVGRTVRVEGVPFTIVGVAARKFDGLLVGFPPRLLMPLSQMPNQATGGTLVTSRDFYSCWIIARSANASLNKIRAHLREVWPDLLRLSVPPTYSAEDRNSFLSTRVSVTDVGTGMDYVLRARFRRPLVVLAIVSSLVLLICCVNTAGLFLLRSLGRQREIAIQLAMGATRLRVVVRLVLEGVLVAMCAAFVAIPLAFLSLKPALALIDSLFENLSILPVLDLRVLTFGFGVSLVAAFLSMIVPCLKTGDLDSAELLRTSGHTLTKSHFRVRRALIVFQLALTLGVMIGGGALIETVQDSKKSLVGLEVNRIVEVGLNPVTNGYRGIEAESYYHDLIERVRSIPGVRQATLSHDPPFPPMRDIEQVALQRGSMPTQAITADVVYVTETFFDTFGIPVLQGQAFSRTVENTPRRALVTAALAHRLNAADSIVGEHLIVGSPPEMEDVEVSGIVGNLPVTDVHTAKPLIVFLNYWDYPRMELWPTISLSMDTNTVPITAVTETVQSAGREYPTNVRTLKAQRDNQLLEERLLEFLSTILCIVAMLLAIMGVYSILSYNVSSKKYEIGIRVAVGAQKADIFWLIARQALGMAVMGGILGIPFAVGLLEVAAHFLTGFRPFAPLAFAASVGVFVPTTMIAALGPCVRAARIDPIVAIRDY